MIQKTGHIILSFLMLVATIGITVSKHYCGTNVRYHLFTDETCEMENMPMNSMHDFCTMDGNCCHTEIESIQLHVDYITENKLELNTDFSFVLFYFSRPIFLQAYNISTKFQFKNDIALLLSKYLTQSRLQTFLC